MQNGQITEEQLNTIADELITARGDQLDAAAREAFKHQLVEQISDAIDKAFIEALPEDCLQAMATLAEQENPSEAEFAAIMQKANLDKAAIITGTLNTFRQNFLNKA